MGREARDAQAGKKRRNRIKKKSKKGKRARKSKGKKQKARKGRRTNKKVGKGRNNRRNNKKNGGKIKKSGRQSGDCLADVVTAIKGHRSAGNQKRMAMRISAWKKNMGKKKDKAATQFGDAADSLDAATGGGQSCGSGKPDSDTTDALAKLKNCSK